MVNFISSPPFHGYMGVSMSGGYVQIRLPKELVDEIDKLVGKLGYRSRSEIIKEAVRRLLFPTPPRVEEIKEEG